MLPIAGGLLAAFAGYERWPTLLSLLAMAVMASAAGVIYWSAPLSRRKQDDAEQQSAFVPDVSTDAVDAYVPPEEIARATALNTSSQSASDSAPEPGNAGTRAEALATGEWREMDLLTGLMNADTFLVRIRRELERCTAVNQTAILILCDLDRFGAINQQAGLVAANHLLRQAADCFRLTVREGDMLARMSGDEFGIFFPGLPPEIAETRARDLRAAVREAGLLVLEDGSPQVTACLGISSFPSDGTTADALLTAANLALATAKRERQENATKAIPSVLVVSRS